MSAASKDKYIIAISISLAIARLGEFMANIDTKHYSDVNSAVETFSDILVPSAKESVVFKGYKKT